MKYFGHDSDAHMNRKFRMLLMEFGENGMTAYGLYWLVNERIATSLETGTTSTCCLRDDIAVIQDLSKLPKDEILKYLNFMASEKCGLLVKADGRFYNPKLLERLDIYTKRRTVKLDPEFDAIKAAEQLAKRLVRK